MKEPIVRTIVIEEREGKPLMVRFTPNPKESEVSSKADAVHHLLYEHACQICQSIAKLHGKESDFYITED